MSTQNGSVTIEDSIFEWTGAMNVTLAGSGSLSVKRNQFRANCQIDLRPVWDPTRAPIFHAFGNPSGSESVSRQQRRIRIHRVQRHAGRADWRKLRRRIERADRAALRLQSVPLPARHLARQL